MRQTMRIIRIFYSNGDHKWTEHCILTRITLSKKRVKWAYLYITTMLSLLFYFVVFFLLLSLFPLVFVIAAWPNIRNPHTIVFRCPENNWHTFKSIAQWTVIHSHTKKNVRPTIAFRIANKLLHDMHVCVREWFDVV